MRALSIRQPYAKKILRGIKTVEYRSRKTGIVGRRFYIYAAGKIPEQADTAQRFKKLGHAVGGLPAGVLVGTAKISVGSSTPFFSGPKPFCGLENLFADSETFLPGSQPFFQAQNLFAKSATSFPSSKLLYEAGKVHFRLKNLALLRWRGFAGNFF